MQNSIRRDLSIRIGLAILGVILLIGTTYYTFSIRIAQKEFDNFVAHQTKQIADTFTLQLWLFDLATTRRLGELVLESPEVVGLRLEDHSKSLLFESGRTSAGKDVIQVHEDLWYEGKTQVGSMDIFYSNTAQAKQRNAIMAVGFLMLLGTLLSSFLYINLLLKRYLTKPLADLEKDMALLAQGQFPQSDLREQKSEIQNIIDAFNDLTTKLQQRDREVGSKTEALVQEIAERQRTEKLLRRSQEEWERTFNAMSDIVTIQDKDMRIVQANRSTFDFFKARPEEVIGKHCFELFQDCAHPCADCPQSDARTRRKTSSSTVYNKKLDKTFLVSFAPIFNEKGELELLVHTAKDVTRQKELETELMQAHKMEAVGTLAGGIAHDFNNILSAIIGYGEIAREELPAGSLVRSDIEQILQAGNRAKELVKQILTFSRKNQQERMPLRPQPIIKEALKLMRASLPTTIEINEEISQDCGAILANPTQLHQIIVNLCTNALHAMENEQGVLSVTLGPKRLAQQDLVGFGQVAPGNFIELSVSDTGMGMDEETVGRIFEPFFTTKEVGKGSGMGLAVVHGIVQECGGVIKVDSTPGYGSTFRVFFPVIAEEQVSTEEKDNTPLPIGHERILIVDDEEVIVKIQRKALTRLGYSVTTTTSGQKARDLFLADPDGFDLLITDQTMPDLTGAELAKEILAIRPDFPIMLCTGYSAVLSEEQAKALGIKAYLIKPVHGKELAAAIRKVLDSGAA